jgi:signal transduction histidine kinase
LSWLDEVKVNGVDDAPSRRRDRARDGIRRGLHVALGQSGRAGRGGVRFSGWRRLLAERARVASHAIFAGLVAGIAGAAFVAGLLVQLRDARKGSRTTQTERARTDADHARLIEAIENLNEGFVLFDADDRLVICNQRFRETYREIGDRLAPGLAYADVKRLGAERGLFPEAENEIDEWVARSMGERQRFTPHEQRLSGNRWIMVSNRPTRDGGFVGVRTDITELKRREQELQLARANLEGQAERMRGLAEEAQIAKGVLQDAIESINEGFSLYDENDRLVMCNSRWLDLHARIRDRIKAGVAFADILRAAIGSGQLVAREDIEAEVRERIAARRHAERTTLEEQFDDDRWIRVSTRRMSGGGIVSVLNDITALKQREFALNSARARLEKQAGEMSTLAEAAQRANRAKTEFLAMMSHEIRTPLNGVIGALGLVADEKLPTRAIDLVDTARVSAHSLLAILNDVLDMSKIEAGKLELEPAPFRLRDLVDGVASLCRVQAGAKGLEFRARLADDLPEWVSGDAGRIRQMALNYAMNAVKFTEEGSIDFEIARAAGGGDSIRFEVIDTGIGIPLEQHGRVFRDFTQLDQSLRRRYGGTGLGLAITRRLARMMGGAIGFESTPDVGSAFWFEIPLPAIAAAPTGEPARDEARAFHVLIEPYPAFAK